jgi:hypothetical protein
MTAEEMLPGSAWPHRLDGLIGCRTIVADLGAGYSAKESMMLPGEIRVFRAETANPTCEAS